MENEVVKQTPASGGSPLDDGLDDEQFMEAFSMIAAKSEKHAFQLIAGMFVGFLEYLALKNGSDKNADIKIEGDGGRDITIHAVSPNAELRGGCPLTMTRGTTNDR